MLQVYILTCNPFSCTITAVDNELIKENIMSKAHRGAGVRELPKSGRGECPVCKRTAVKTLYEIEANSKKVKICKICKAAIANGKLKEQVAAL
jgi:hypothetical protein